MELCIIEETRCLGKLPIKHNNKLKNKLWSVFEWKTCDLRLELQSSAFAFVCLRHLDEIPCLWAEEYLVLDCLDITEL